MHPDQQEVNDSTSVSTKIVSSLRQQPLDREFQYQKLKSNWAA